MKKYGLWLVLVGAVCCALVLAGCSPKQKGLSDEEAYKHFVGTWVNTDYPGTTAQSQITVIRPDHVGEDWLLPNSTGPTASWTIKVKKTWLDEKGDIYCQFFYKNVDFPTQQYGVLMRVDAAGTTWECCSQRAVTEETAVYPDEIDPSIAFYWIYYRKK
jgi:hypothetical protein